MSRCSKCIHRKVCGYKEYYSEKERDGIDKCTNYKEQEERLTVYVIEYGSSYDNDPWEIEAIFAHRKGAMDYIDTRVQRDGIARSLLHITKWEVQK